MPKRRHQIIAGLSIFALLTLVLRPNWERQWMASGPYWYWDVFELQSGRDMMAAMNEREELLFYRDGLTATVTVAVNRKSDPPHVYFAVNGKVDGGNGGDMPTQRLLAHIPLMIHPDPKEVAVERDDHLRLRE